MLPHRTTARKVFAITAGVVFGLTAAGVAVATRNSGGTYSLPAGNPVVTGTPITITWANTTLSDLGTEMTNSLSRDGYGGMRAALKGTDGTVAAPAFSFTNEAGTGIYRIGASNPGLSVAGTKRQEWTTSGTTVNGTVKASDGLVAGPAYSFASEAGTGLYRIGASNPGLAVAGSKRQEWSTTGTTVTGTLQTTGAATLASATVTGNLEVQGTTGVTLTQGDVVMSEAAGQAVTKSGGSLTLGTSDANDVVINRGGSAALTFGSSGPAFAGKPTATATVSGDGATTLVTKGYVGGLAPWTKAAWAILTCGAAGAVTVTAGSGVTSASYSGNSISVNWSSAFTSETSYVMTATNGTNQSPASFVPVCTKGGSGSGAVGKIFGTDYAGTARSWADGDVILIMAVGT